MKKIFLITLMSLITVLMAGMVHGVSSCTFDQTATTAGTASTYIRGTEVNLSATIAGYVDPGDNLTTCSITVNTGTITGTLDFNTTSMDANETYCNTTVNTMQLSDDTTYTFTMTMRNHTQDLITSCTRNFITDNTKPVVSLTTPTDDSKDSDGTVSFSYTCPNSSSANIYLEEGTGYQQFAMTESSDTCTYTYTFMTDGIHSHYIIGSDGLNTTTSSVSKVEIRTPGGIIYDEQGNIMVGTAGATVKSGNIVTNVVNGIFDFIFGIFESIFSIFK